MKEKKKYCKVRDYCCYTEEYRGAAHSICNLKKSALKIPIVFHNGWGYDYQFTINKFGGEFKNQFTCLRGKTKKYITFANPIEKEVSRIDKNGKKLHKTQNISAVL